MKKVIIGLLLICVVAGLVAVGTWAAFRDVETSTDNLFTAGSMDLKVDGEDDPIKAYFDTIECVKPGDSGEVTIELSNVGCVDGLLDLHLTITESDENIAVEPELNVGDLADDDMDPFDGELAAEMQMKITADLPPASIPVIDGSVAPGEWAGATPIPVAGGMGTVSVMAGGGYLYVLFDVLDSTDARLGENTIGNDKIGLNINPTDGGPWGKPYDIVFQTGADPAAFTTVPPGGVSSGMSDGWYTEWVVEGTQYALPGDLETMTLYDYGTGTRISEWKVPLASIAPSIGDTLKVGGACDNLHVPAGPQGGSYLYPPELDWGDASTYVDVVYELWKLVAAGSVSEIACTNYVYGALDAGDSVDLTIEWWVPAEVGNIIMTDTLEFDIEFSLDQAMEACLTVVDIDQPDQVQECETVDISVEVKNTGGMAGECDLNVTVTDPAGTVIDSAVVPTGTISSLETKSVLVFDDLHIPVPDPPIAVPYTVTVSAIDCCTAEEVICEIEVTAPPALHVVDIVQPATAFWCEETPIDVYVHNDGGKPGECEVTVYVVDETQTPIMPPIVVPVPVVAPCDTVVVPVTIHAEEGWPPMVVVAAMACADIEPIPCLPPIEVAPPPALAGVGSEWEYKVTYPPETTETTYWDFTMAGRGLTDPLPAMDCLTPPSGEGPYYHLSWTANASCACTEGDPCLFDGSDSPLRTMTGGAMGMIIQSGDTYGKESNLTDQMSLAPSCGDMAGPPPMTNLPMTAELAYDTYASVVGNVGYPYTAGNQWTYTSYMDSWLPTMMTGMCASLLAPFPPSLCTADVIATGVSVTVPAGTFTDCVQIDTVCQVDNDGDGSYNEDPIDTPPYDDDGDTLIDEDPVETCVQTTWWSPTTFSIVKQVNPCGFDLTEVRELNSYTLEP